MNKIILSIAIISCGVLSFNLSADTSTTVGDLLYLQNANQLLVTNDFVMGLEKYDRETFAPGGSKTKFAEMKRQTRLSKLDLTYGLNDQFSVGLGTDISFRNSLVNENVTMHPSGAVSNKEPTIKDNGILDPRATSKYRYLNSGSVISDLLVNISPSVTTAKRGAIFNGQQIVSKGDYQRGSHQVEIGNMFGYKLGADEFKFNLMYQLNLRGKQKYMQVDPTAENAKGDMFYNEDMRSEYSFDATYNWKFFQYTWLVFGLGATYHEDTHKIGKLHSGVDSEISTSSYISQKNHFEVRFKLLQDFYTSLAYNMYLFTDRNTVYKTGGQETYSETINKDRAHEAVLNLTAVFF